MKQVLLVAVLLTLSACIGRRMAGYPGGSAVRRYQAWLSECQKGTPKELYDGTRSLSSGPCLVHAVRAGRLAGFRECSIIKDLEYMGYCWDEIYQARTEDHSPVNEKDCAGWQPYDPCSATGGN